MGWWLPTSILGFLIWQFICQLGFCCLFSGDRFHYHHRLARGSRFRDFELAGTRRLPQVLELLLHWSLRLQEQFQNLAPGRSAPACLRSKSRNLLPLAFLSSLSSSISSPSSLLPSPSSLFYSPSSSRRRGPSDVLITVSQWIPACARMTGRRIVCLRRTSP